MIKNNLMKNNGHSQLNTFFSLHLAQRVNYAQHCTRTKTHTHIYSQRPQDIVFVR